jgi:allophanate hydrolase
MNLPKTYSIQDLKSWYASERFTPEEVLKQILKRIENYRDKNIWIKAFDLDEMMTYLSKAKKDAPLYGIPFAIKDNIDLEGVETTAGCSSYAYTPKDSAFVVKQLLQAGAIPVGKTNMDQFATGLVGTRSPYGECSHSVHEECISGGSSSGSAVALALGMCAFSLGTDTAGSGRVPAALNKISGYKPTPGLLSIEGVVPACLSLDTISVFYQHSEDLKMLSPIVSEKNSADAFQTATIKSTVGDKRPFATLDLKSVEWKGSGNYQKLFKQAIPSLQAQGYVIEEVDLETFFEVARLLYEGPWVAERYAAVGEFIEKGEPDLDPTVKKIVLGAKDLKAVDAFRAQYKLTEKKHVIEKFFRTYQGLILPTIGGWFTKEEIQKKPVELNSYLGTFTNFANLLGLTACSFPFNIPSLKEQPGFGLTLFMPGGEDTKVIETSGKMSEALDFVSLAVCGAHLSGEPLNYQLTDLGAVFRRCTRTTPNYEMVALSSFKPGMYRNEIDGFAIEVEVWDIPSKNLGIFVNKIDSPLGVGKVEICDGQMVTGFLIENFVVEGLENISRYGSWRQYKNS